MKDSTCVLNLHIDAEFALPYQLPSISYGLIAWGQAVKTHLNKILLIQKRVVRLMNFAKFSVHAVPLFFSTNILPLPLLYFKNCSILMHNVYNKVVPSNSSNLFTPTKDVHHYNTCSSTAGDLYIYKPLSTKSGTTRTLLPLWAQIFGTVYSRCYETAPKIQTQEKNYWILTSNLLKNRILILI